MTKCEEFYKRQIELLNVDLTPLDRAVFRLYGLMAISECLGVAISADNGLERNKYISEGQDISNLMTIILGDHDVR